MKQRIELDEIPEPRGPEVPTGKEVEEKLQAKVKAEQLKKYPTIKPKGNFMGIQQLKDAVLTICKFTNAIVESVADDGKITLGDFPKFINPVISLPAAIIGIGEVPAELDDLTEEERAELIQFVQDELQLGDKAELVATKALNILYELKSIINLLKPDEQG